MKFLNLVIAITTILTSVSSFAIYNEKYSPKNHALTCGNIVILTSNYTTVHHSKMVADNMDLGISVQAVRNGTTVEMRKTEDAEKPLFGLGEAKGFGYFDGGIYKLDLRNTRDNNVIYLELPETNEKIKCEIKGDCC